MTPAPALSKGRCLSGEKTKDGQVGAGEGGGLPFQSQLRDS